MFKTLQPNIFNGTAGITSGRLLEIGPASAQNSGTTDANNFYVEIQTTYPGQLFQTSGPSSTSMFAKAPAQFFRPVRNNRGEEIRGELGYGLISAGATKGPMHRLAMSGDDDPLPETQGYMQDDDLTNSIGKYPLRGDAISAPCGGWQILLHSLYTDLTLGKGLTIAHNGENDLTLTRTDRNGFKGIRSTLIAEEELKKSPYDWQEYLVNVRTGEKDAGSIAFYTCVRNGELGMILDLSSSVIDLYDLEEKSPRDIFSIPFMRWLSYQAVVHAKKGGGTFQIHGLHKEDLPFILRLNREANFSKDNKTLLIAQPGTGDPREIDMGHPDSSVDLDAFEGKILIRPRGFDDPHQMIDRSFRAMRPVQAMPLLHNQPLSELVMAHLNQTLAHAESRSDEPYRAYMNLVIKLIRTVFDVVNEHCPKIVSAQGDIKYLNACLTLSERQLGSLSASYRAVCGQMIQRNINTLLKLAADDPEKKAPVALRKRITRLSQSNQMQELVREMPGGNPFRQIAAKHTDLINDLYAAEEVLRRSVIEDLGAMKSGSEQSKYLLSRFGPALGHIFELDDKGRTYFNMIDISGDGKVKYEMNHDFLLYMLPISPVSSFYSILHYVYTLRPPAENKYVIYGKAIMEAGKLVKEAPLHAEQFINGLSNVIGKIIEGYAKFAKLSLGAPDAAVVTLQKMRALTERVREVPDPVLRMVITFYLARHVNLMITRYGKGSSTIIEGKAKKGPYPAFISASIWNFVENGGEIDELLKKLPEFLGIPPEANVDGVMSGAFNNMKDMVVNDENHVTLIMLKAKLEQEEAAKKKKEEEDRTLRVQREEHLQKINAAQEATRRRDEETARIAAAEAKLARELGEKQLRMSAEKERRVRDISAANSRRSIAREVATQLEKLIFDLDEGMLDTLTDEKIAEITLDSRFRENDRRGGNDTQNDRIIIPNPAWVMAEIGRLIETAKAVAERPLTEENATSAFPERILELTNIMRSAYAKLSSFVK